MLTYECTAPADKISAMLIDAINDNKMRLVSHINGQANAAKTGREVPADQILEVFRPDFAIRVWEACKPAGMDIPLRIHIYEDKPGITIVSYRMAVETFAPYETPALTAIGKEIDAIFINILSVANTAEMESKHD